VSAGPRSRRPINCPGVVLSQPQAARPRRSDWPDRLLDLHGQQVPKQHGRGRICVSPRDMAGKFRAAPPPAFQTPRFTVATVRAKACVYRAFSCRTRCCRSPMTGRPFEQCLGQALAPLHPAAMNEAVLVLGAVAPAAAERFFSCLIYMINGTRRLLDHQWASCLTTGRHFL